MERNAINKNGSTAMDVCMKSRNDVIKKEIWQSLKRANELPAKDALKRESEHRARLEDHRSSLMVVASLIATMAFQIGVNPPGGSWQEDTITTTTAGHEANPPVGVGQLNNKFHFAGRSILADRDEEQYMNLMLRSSVAVVSSLSVILLLISGLPCNRLFVGVLMTTMWIAITALTLTYASSIAYLSNFDSKHLGELLSVIVFFWLILMLMLLLTHAGRFIVKLIKRLYHKCFSRPATANHPPV